MKINYFAWISILLILLSCSRKAEKSYPFADAVYLNLTKTFILNKDGSIINSVEKRQKLLTYRSFQSLYGETRINYNPDIQKLVVKEAYTVNSQNQQIRTPENGFNDLLPAFCLDSKAYSHLREMVVSHTGIERNAVTNCSWEITTQPGKIPVLMGIEELQTDCPIEKLTILIKVPSGKSLHYNLLNFKGEPTLDKGSEFDSYSWSFNDIPQRVKEFRSGSLCEDMPTLLFSTQDDRSEPLSLISSNKGLAGPLSDETKTYINDAIKGEKGIAEKALKIQGVVVNELKTIHVPASLVAFQIRTPEEVWRSNSGTPFEKAALLTSLLRSAGINAELNLAAPECCGDPVSPFLLLSEPVVAVTVENGEVILLSSEKLNSRNLDVAGFNSTIIPLNSSQKALHSDKPTGTIHIEGELVVNSNGGIKGELTGLFSNAFNPCFELMRNPGKCPLLLSDFPGMVTNLKADKAEIHFKVDKSDLVVERGDFRFIDLKESKIGISSLHLMALPFVRTTQLNLGSGINESYHYTYKLPQGFELLNPVKIELSKPGIGEVFVSLSQTGNSVEVIRKIEISKPSVTREGYPGFKLLMDKWNTQKYRQLIFKKKL
ncbi:MAG: DUF3857 domain-containing protein [Mariniphaga sp.]